MAFPYSTKRNHDGISLFLPLSEIRSHARKESGGQANFIAATFVAKTFSNTGTDI